MIQSDTSDIFLFGAGGHAKSVISVLLSLSEWRLVGLLEEPTHRLGGDLLGYPVLGNEEQLEILRKQGVTKCLVAIGNNAARGRIADLLRAQSFELISIVHPTALLLADCSIGSGSFMHALSLIGAECEIGNNAIIQPYTTIGHEGRVGVCAQFCPGVHIGGNVTIGDYCFFGPGAVVHPGLTIGSFVEVGANTVVTKNIQDHSKVIGNPAKKIFK